MIRSHRAGFGPGVVCGPMRFRVVASATSVGGDAMPSESDFRNGMSNRWNVIGSRMVVQQPIMALVDPCEWVGLADPPASPRTSQAVSAVTRAAEPAPGLARS